LGVAFARFLLYTCLVVFDLRHVQCNLERVGQMDKMKLGALRQSIGIRRWHTHRNLNQSLGDHIAGMHMIIEVYHPNPSVDLLRAINLHDAHEVKFGDLPFSAKTSELRALEKAAQEVFLMSNDIDFPSLSDEELLWMKFADQFDAYLFLCEEPCLTDKQELIKRRAFEEATAYAAKLNEYGYTLHIEGETA
jgi:5'-deoxynucleotidase YfbR-like HD superfamily hydrolase